MSDMQAARLLHSAIATLEAAVVPELSRDDSKIALDLVIRVLGMLRSRFSTGEEGLEKLLAATRKVLAEDDVSGLAAVPSDVTKLSPLQRLESERKAVEQKLSELIPQLVAEAGQKKQPAGQASKVLQQIVHDQRDYLALQDPDILKGIAVVYQAGRIYRDQKDQPPAKPVFDDDSVGNYLRKKFPDAEGVSASGVKVLTGGFSKVTVLFTKNEKGAPAANLVLRRDLPVPFMKKAVLDEFPLLQRLHRAGVRVAEPCWTESDNGVFGGAFMVSRCVAGTSNPGEWKQHPGAAKQVAIELAEVLAQLHGLDLGKLGYGADIAGKSAGQGVADEIAWWAERYSEWKAAGSYPLIDIPLAWLQQNIPQHLYAMPARVVHGDVGFHNLMVDMGKVTALLDWEFSHFGDPMEDLAFARMFLNQVSAWDDFMTRYLACGGIAFSAESERFFNVWTSVRNSIGTIDAMGRFENTPFDQVELKYAVSGVLSPYIQLDSSALVLKYLSENHKGDKS